MADEAFEQLFKDYAEVAALVDTPGWKVVQEWAQRVKASKLKQLEGELAGFVYGGDLEAAKKVLALRAELKALDVFVGMPLTIISTGQQAREALQEPRTEETPTGD